MANTQTIQSQKSRNSLAVKNVGKEDVNFPEFLLGVMDSKRANHSNQEIQFIDPLKPENKIGIVPSGLGFPTQFDRDVYRALMKITKEKNSFCNPDVPVTRREISQIMGLPDSGSILKRVEQSLDLLTGVRVKFYNSYFDMEKREEVEEVLNIGILSSYRLDNRESRKKNKGKADEKVAGLDPNTIRWSKEFWNLSLKQARNLIDYDYSLYRSLKGSIAKELYIFLNKRAYSNKFFSIPLKVLAFEKLGMSRTQEKRMSKVRQQLRDAHKKLMDIGFFTVEPKINKGSNGEFVSYSFAVRYPSQTKGDNSAFLDPVPLIPNSDLEKLKKELTAIGFNEGQVGKMYQKHDKQFLYDGLELLAITKNVRSKKSWFLGYLKGDYDMSDLEEKRCKEKAEEEFEKQEQKRRQEEAVKEQEQAEKSAKENALVNDWIAVNPLKWVDMCKVYIETEFEQENSFMYNNLLKKAQESGQDSLEMFMSTRMYNYALRGRVLEQVSEEKVEK